MYQDLAEVKSLSLPLKNPSMRGFCFINHLLFMKIIKFLNLSSEKVFAKSLVDKLVVELPPSLMENRRKILSVNKITRLLEGAYQAAGVYKFQNNIGFLRSAILANSFKWSLKNAGYSSDFIDMATEGLVVELSKKNSSSK